LVVLTEDELTGVYYLENKYKIKNMVIEEAQKQKTAL